MGAIGNLKLTVAQDPPLEQMKELKEKKGSNAHYDFLIIGSGLAGLYAANYGSEFGSVALITKSTLPKEWASRIKR